MKEEETLEKLLRNAIFYKEDELREITIAEAKASLEIARIVFESQSQNPESLMRGLGYCHFIQRSIIETEIFGYDEIGSSEKEIKSLKKGIIQRLLDSGTLTEITQRMLNSGTLVTIEEVRKEEFSETDYPFEINPN